MSTRALLERFDDWRAEGRRLVLATVFETDGSTYSKAGHRILISEDGRYQGLVSGGCLEGDLALHASAVIANGQPRTIEYDLRREQDEVFGLGVGCDGMLRILLQPMDADTGYQPFAAMESVLGGTTPAVAVVLVSDCPGIGPAGATLLRNGPTLSAHALADGGVEALAPLTDAVPALPRLESLPSGGQALVCTLEPMPRWLVLGAGLDVVPLVQLAHAVGLRVTVYDHRPAFLARGDLRLAERLLTGAPDELEQNVTLADFSAAIVMSHHLATDRSYLAQLAPSPIPYVALLGPRARRERLCRELGGAGLALEPRLHGPAGLDIGADSPESIAVSILAEYFAVRSGRAGGSLDLRA